MCEENDDTETPFSLFLSLSRELTEWFTCLDFTRDSAKRETKVLIIKKCNIYRILYYLFPKERRKSTTFTDIKVSFMFARITLILDYASAHNNALNDMSFFIML